MLILNREVGQQIIIDGDIWIKVLSQCPKYVRLGIEAPAHINIVREEVLNHGIWKRRIDKIS
jgi:carbon storage regulator CsrA